MEEGTEGVQVPEPMEAVGAAGREHASWTGAGVGAGVDVDAEMDAEEMRAREGFVVYDEEGGGAEGARPRPQNGAWLRPFPSAPEAVGEDVADAVLARLEPRDLAALAAASRAWRVRCGDDVVWRRLYEARWGAEYPAEGEEEGDENVEAGGEPMSRPPPPRHASYVALYAARHRHERLGGEADGVLREGGYVFAFEAGEARLPLGRVVHPSVPDREAPWTPDPAPAENVLDSLLGLVGDVHASAAEAHAEEQRLLRRRLAASGVPAPLQYAWHPLGVRPEDRPAAQPPKQWRRPLAPQGGHEA